MLLTQSWRADSACHRVDSTTTLPLRATGPPDPLGRPFMTYLPFASNDLYNRKMQNLPFSERPLDLLDLVTSPSRMTVGNCHRSLSSQKRGRGLWLPPGNWFQGANRTPTQVQPCPRVDLTGIITLMEVRRDTGALPPDSNRGPPERLPGSLQIYPR